MINNLYFVWNNKTYFNIFNRKFITFCDFSTSILTFLFRSVVNGQKLKYLWIVVVRLKRLIYNGLFNTLEITM